MPSNKNGQNWIWLPTRLAIYLRDGLRCVWCSRAGSPLGYGLTLDHVGRSNRPRDLVTACVSCNSSGRDRPLTPEQRAHVRGYRYRTLDRSAGRALLERRRAARLEQERLSVG